MRIQAVTEISTNQQQNPHIIRSAGAIAAGKSASAISFEECLKSQIQETRTSNATRNAEWHAVSSFWGYSMPQGAPIKPDLKQTARAYEIQSDY